MGYASTLKLQQYSRGAMQRPFAYQGSSRPLGDLCIRLTIAELGICQPSCRREAGDEQLNSNQLKNAVSQPVADTRHVQDNQISTGGDIVPVRDEKRRASESGCVLGELDLAIAPMHHQAHALIEGLHRAVKEVA